MPSYSDRISKKYGAGSSPLTRQAGASNQYGSTVYGRSKPKPTATESKAKPRTRAATTRSGPASAGPPRRPVIHGSRPTRSGPPTRPKRKRRPTAGPTVMSGSPRLGSPPSSQGTAVKVGRGSSGRLGDRPLRQNRRAAQSKARLHQPRKTDTDPLKPRTKLKNILKGFPNRPKTY